MEVTYVYTKKRAEFGRQCNFSDKPAEVVADVIPEPQERVDFIDRNPCDLALQCSFEFSEHEVSSRCSMAGPTDVWYHMRSDPLVDSKVTRGDPVTGRRSGIYYKTPNELQWRKGW